MNIPTPPELARGRVTWTVGRTDGTTLPGARGTVRFEATAVAVTYSTATVLPAPVETPVVAGMMTPVDLLVNDPEVWNWRVTPRVGVTWDPFHIDVAGPVNLATAAVVPGKGPIRAVKGVKGDPGTATTIAQVDGLSARLAALEYRSGVRNTSTLLTNATGTVIIERTGPMITLSLDGITPTSALASGATFITLPSGFRPTRRYDVHLISTATTTSRSGFMFASGGMGLWLPSTSDRYRLVMTFPTNDPIPATLPGVPG